MIDLPLPFTDERSAMDRIENLEAGHVGLTTSVDRLRRAIYLLAQRDEAEGRSVPAAVLRLILEPGRSRRLPALHVVPALDPLEPLEHDEHDDASPSSAPSSASSRSANAEKKRRHRLIASALAAGTITRAEADSFHGIGRTRGATSAEVSAFLAARRAEGAELGDAASQPGQPGRGVEIEPGQPGRGVEIEPGQPGRDPASGGPRPGSNRAAEPGQPGRDPVATGPTGSPGPVPLADAPPTPPPPAAVLPLPVPVSEPPIVSSLDSSISSSSSVIADQKRSLTASIPRARARLHPAREGAHDANRANRANRAADVARADACKPNRANRANRAAALEAPAIEDELVERLVTEAADMPAGDEAPLGRVEASAPTDARAEEPGAAHGPDAGEGGDASAPCPTSLDPRWTRACWAAVDAMARIFAEERPGEPCHFAPNAKGAKGAAHGHRFGAKKAADRALRVVAELEPGTFGPRATALVAEAFRLHLRHHAGEGGAWRLFYKEAQTHLRAALKSTRRRELEQRAEARRPAALATDERRQKSAAIDQLFGPRPKP